MFVVVVAAAGSLVGTTVRAEDRAGAIEQLKQGYALKQAGNCRDAIPHFAESARLDPQAKAMLNLADCEAQGGDLVRGQQHARAGRDLARQRNDSELLDVAEQQLAALEKRLPKLILRLARTAPAGTVVALEGTRVAGASVGVPVPVNAGHRVVTVTAVGYAERRFEIDLVEGAQKDVEVEPGRKLVDVSPSSSSDSRRTPGDEDTASSISTRTIVAFALGGVGVVGLGLGCVFRRS